MKERYVVFKDDDVGKDLNRLKKWVDVVLQNDAKGALGLIGKYMSNKELIEFLKSLDSDKIEIFCHGYLHSYFPFLIRKKFGKNHFITTEFDKSFNNHSISLKKYREHENKYLNKKAIAFGPPGNIWNNDVPKALLENGFKLMFSWEKVGSGIFTIPLTSNFKQNSLDEFIKEYNENKNAVIYTLQFHHASLSEEQFRLMATVIDFLKNKENRIFINPSELLAISKKNNELFTLISS